MQPRFDRRHALSLAALAALHPGLFPGVARATRAIGGYALTLYDEARYPRDFSHLDHVNPDAPKGGFVRLGEIGTFDNLNPFILRGVSFVRYANTIMSSGTLFDSLMSGTGDEVATAYPAIAKAVELAEDRLSVTFTIDERARFHDGSPILASDAAWTFETLLEKGTPVYAVVLADIAACEAIDERRVRYIFKNATNRQLAFTAASLPVLPERWWQGRAFDEPTLDPPLGSGPYRIADVRPGAALVWERVRDYWAADLPINRGTANFDRVQVDYYRDHIVLREAFKAGLVDMREENTASDWFTAYDFPAIDRGLVKKEQIQHQVPQGMQSFIFNTRRPIFQDIRVRRALGYAFDFQWYNKTYFYDSYKRTRSYWENSDLAARGLPEGEELALLERYRDRLPKSVFEEVYEPVDYPAPDGLRDGLRRAIQLLGEAGWVFEGGTLVNEETRQPFAFEFMLDEPRLERVVLPFLKNLERLGIKGTLRNVDTAQYDLRQREFDFDMLTVRYGTSMTPGDELRTYYGSVAARTFDSPNLAGIADPVVDEMIEAVIDTESYDALVPRVKALDRVLLHGHYGIPCWYSDYYRILYWTKFGRPERRAPYVSMLAGSAPAWWVDDGLEATMARAKTELPTP